MKCRKAQKLILSYADLDASRKAKLSQHLKTCPHCSHEFSLHQNSFIALKEAVNFEESRDFWNDFRVNLERRIPSASLWRKVWTKVEGLTCLFRTPVLGPVPAYVFSFVLITLLTVSLYPEFLSSRNTQRFSNDLEPYGLELISAVDNGVETIYTFANR
jgi:anti-sigma factor RsiW